MYIRAIDKSTSPQNPASLRVTARIECDSGEVFDIWFEVSQQLADAVSETANPWILCVLPYAVVRGESIRTHYPADPALLENLRGLMATWHQWYPWIKPVVIEVPALKYTPKNEPMRVAAFFSGGVDSWFTVLRHSPERAANAIGHVNDLIYVEGFDIPLERMSELEKMVAGLKIEADGLERTLIVMRTNLRRRKSPWEDGWGWLSHGCGLAAAAMILEKRLEKVLIGSTHPFGRLTPWGSHPMTDALFSTSTLQVNHDGAMYSRVEKTALIAAHKQALRSLHVCWKESSSSNCGRCPKCVRTMATLALVGANPKDLPFPRLFDPEQLRRLYLNDENDVDFICEILEAAELEDNQILIHASKEALTRSRRLRPFVRWLDRLRQAVHKLHSVPVIWRFESPVISKLQKLDPRETRD